MRPFSIMTAASAAMLAAGAVLAQPAASGNPIAQQGMGMTHGGSAQSPGQPQTAKGSGVVKSVDAAKRRVNLSHGPIPAINWPAMTMEFDVAPGVDLGGIRAEQPVEFTLQGAAGTYTITQIGARSR
ncbi:MAG: copper-binding protein [Alphaproteobacteria bacterium]